MILRLKENKKLSFYQKNPIYIGEKDFDIIEVLIPPKVDNNNTEDLNFILHIVNKKGEYIHITLKKEQRSSGIIGITKIDTTITHEVQDFFLYLEMIKGEEEIIGKTNCVEITIEPLPDENTIIIPEEEYKEIIDELTEIIQKNTEAMNRINGFENGKSAYEIAIEEGFVGSEEDWLESLKGTDGAQGVSGRDGIDGKSAYEVAVEKGYSGTEEEWLASLKGADGATGQDGKDGKDGANGLSAYEVAVSQGYSGTEVEWLKSLKGADGPQGVPGNDYVLTAQDKTDIANIVLQELPTTEGVLYGN